jgi:beta-hydroxylase
MVWLILASIILILILIFIFIDGYYLVNVVNSILADYSHGPEFISTKHKWCKTLRDNYREIRNEYIDYSVNQCQTAQRFADLDYTQSFVDTGYIPWEVIILRIYNKDTNKIKHFPKTYNFIKDIPGCSLAMFSVLKPGKKLDTHKGPSKSVLRYHLSLITPKNNEECYLTVNDKKYIWRTGSDIMFDDTYDHSAENNTNETRVVLFLDIQREYNNFFLDWLNGMILHYAQYNSTVVNIVDKVNSI